MYKDDELKPRGGCACATGVGEIECRYCAKVIPVSKRHRLNAEPAKQAKSRTWSSKSQTNATPAKQAKPCTCRECKHLSQPWLAHQTCEDCAAEWEAAFPKTVENPRRWFEQPWHTELDAEFAELNPIMYRGVVPLSKVVNVSEENAITTSHHHMRKQFYTVYCAMKNILIVAYAARNSAIIAATGVDQNDPRLRALQELGTALGPVKMRQLLVAYDFKDDGGTSLMSIPSDDVLHKYLRSIREEVREYIPTAEIIEFPQARAQKFGKRVAAVA